MTRMKRAGLGLGVLGLITAAAYGLLPINFDAQPLSTTEAWERGVAQPYVASGLALIVLAFFLFRGASWPRWPILLWCPITIIGGMAWAVSRGVAMSNPAEFAVLGLPILLIWLWGIHHMLFKAERS